MVFLKFKQITFEFSNLLKTLKSPQSSPRLPEAPQGSPRLLKAHLHITRKLCVSVAANRKVPETRSRSLAKAPQGSPRLPHSSQERIPKASDAPQISPRSNGIRVFPKLKHITFESPPSSGKLPSSQKLPEASQDYRKLAKTVQGSPKRPFLRP